MARLILLTESITIREVLQAGYSYGKVYEVMDGGLTRLRFSTLIAAHRHGSELNMIPSHD